MYLRALDRTSSRCSPTVSLVMRGTLLRASLTFCSVVLVRLIDIRLALSRGRRIVLDNLGFFGFFMRLIRLLWAGRIRIGSTNSFFAQYFQESFLNPSRMVHLVNGQVSHVCLHLYCTKSEQRFLQA